MTRLAKVRSFFRLPVNRRRRRSPGPSVSSDDEVASQDLADDTGHDQPSTEAIDIGRQARTRPSDPPTTSSKEVQTPPDNQILPSQSVSRAGPTYRETALPSANGHFSLTLILENARTDFKDLFSTGRSEPNAQGLLFGICRHVWRRNPDYRFHGYQPSCEFVLNLSIQYMQVRGGKGLMETEFATTVREMYRYLNTLTTPDLHAISVPDILFVASGLGPPYKSSTGSTGMSDKATSSSHIERRNKKRQKRADQARPDVNLDLDFQVASLAVEMKTAAFFQQFCQILAYLVQLFEINGCRLGLTVNMGWFTRFFVATDRKIYMESNIPSSWGKVHDIVEVRVQLAKRTDYMAHQLRGTTEPTGVSKVNDAAAIVLLDYLQIAAGILANLPFYNVDRNHISRTSELDNYELSRGDRAVALPEMFGEDAAALANRRVTARGARAPLDRALAGLEPDAQRRLAKASSSDNPAKGEGGPDAGDRHDDDGHPDHAPGGSNGRGGGPNDDGPAARNGKQHQGNGEGYSEGDAGDNAGAAGHFTSHTTTAGWGMYESQHTVETDRIEPDLLVEPQTTLSRVTIPSSCSSLAGSRYDEEDDVADHPSPHDPIAQVLQRMGLQVEFCSPENLTALVKRYAAATTAACHGHTQGDPAATAAQLLPHAPVIRVVGQESELEMDLDMPHVKSGGLSGGEDSRSRVVY